MAMRPQLWTISGLATELGADRRTVAAKLAGVPPDGTVHGHPAWRMRAAMAATAPAGGGGPDLPAARARRSPAGCPSTARRRGRGRCGHDPPGRDPAVPGDIGRVLSGSPW
jgi:hypothetical protein